MNDYNDELLEMAHDLVDRLIVAFDTPTGKICCSPPNHHSLILGIPYPRVNLLTGIPLDTINETCLSGAGSLLLEFGVLSRLTNDDLFERLAKRSVKQLFKSRHKETNMFGNIIDVRTGEFTGYMAGVGAGLDSFFEYLLKSYILFNDQNDFDMFIQAYETIQEKLRRGRPHCRYGTTDDPPFFVNVDFRDASIANTWVDSLMVSPFWLTRDRGPENEANYSREKGDSIFKRRRLGLLRVNNIQNFFPLVLDGRNKSPALFSGSSSIEEQQQFTIG